MNIKLIAMDLDGTLNNDEKRITEKTKAALMAAQEKGIRLALASARPSPGLFKERDILRLQDHVGILMSYNGGRIGKAEKGAEKVYVTDAGGYKVDYECRNNNMVCSEVGNLADFLTFAPIKILMSVKPEELPGIQQKIREFLPEELSVVQTAPFYLEVIPTRINKGQGIRDICHALGISTDEVISFGDAANDIPMLQTAGVGVAMGNASQAVKDESNFVTLSNNEDGIAYALEQFLK